MKPCPTHSACPCDANPVGNFSSEAPDRDVFLGFNSGWGNNGPNPGDHWHNGDGFHYCESVISQEDADLCAGGGELDNRLDHGGPGGDGVDPDSGDRTDSHGVPPTLYYNSKQSASATCPDGSIFTYTIPANSVRSTNPTLADRIAASLAEIRANQRLICISSINGACLGVDYDQTITASTETAGDVDWQLRSGTLPPGLEAQFDLLNSKEISIAGTPTQAGNFTFVIRATDSLGNYMEKSFTLAVLAITNSPTQATVGAAYSFQFTADGGTAPYAYSVLAAALPDGLTLSASGLLSGTPENGDQNTFIVTLTDSSP